MKYADAWDALKKQIAESRKDYGSMDNKDAAIKGYVYQDVLDLMDDIEIEFE